MKISPIKLIAFSSLATFLVSSVPVSALTKLARANNQMGQVTVNDLAKEDVAILPGNPFHFMIGLSSSIKGWFVSSGVKEVGFKRDIAGRRAGEVRKLLDWAADNNVLLGRALGEYRESLFAFKTKLAQLGVDDLGSDPEAFLNTTVGDLLTHLRFVREISDSFGAVGDQATITGINNILTDSLHFITTNLDDSFEERAIRLTLEQADAAITIRTILSLDQIIVRLGAEASDTTLFTDEITAIRQALVADLANGLTGPALATAPAETEGPSLADIIDVIATPALQAEIYTAARLR